MKGLSLRRFEWNGAAMNEAACRAKEAASEEDGGAAKNMTALPVKATCGIEALVFYLKINRNKNKG
jgi:hypothetical protein